IVEKFGENIIYVKQELAGMQYKRLMVAGVFLDEAKDRITITQTGIAFDERFPFTEGESRANGTQWVIFQHVTDRLTIVRWSTLNHCPVNANGPLSVEETALNMRISLTENESEESILAKIHSGCELVLMNLRDQFLRRCSRFKLEPITLGSRDFPLNI
ncbi:unnamed protein product, partial [Aphanomyces euteiches]